MPGRVIRLCGRQAFTFTDLGAGGNAEVFLAENIDISAYKEVTLLIRVHLNSMTSQASYIQVHAYPVAPSSEEPTSNFRNAGTSINIDSVVGASPPTLVTLNAGSNIGGWLSISIKAHRNGAEAVAATLSIDLSLKE